MLQQLGYPLAILRVRFPARHGLDVLSIDENHLDPAFQQIPDRFPVDARCFHGQVRYTVSCQPIGQFVYLPCHGPKAPYMALLAAGVGIKIQALMLAL